VNPDAISVTEKDTSSEASHNHWSFKPFTEECNTVTHRMQGIVEKLAFRVYAFLTRDFNFGKN
jgi:hypothetical protein